jgi:hypothetical protein
MEREIMKDQQQILCHLKSSIEGAIALIDLKGTNIQISQALSIVHMAFSHAPLNGPLSPPSLYEQACRMYPHENLVQNRGDA